MANPRMRCIKPDTDQLRAKCRPLQQRRPCEDKLYQNGIDRPCDTSDDRPMPLAKGGQSRTTGIGNTGITKN